MAPFGIFFFLLSLHVDLRGGVLAAGGAIGAGADDASAARNGFGASAALTLRETAGDASSNGESADAGGGVAVLQCIFFL